MIIWKNDSIGLQFVFRDILPVKPLLYSPVWQDCEKLEQTGLSLKAAGCLWGSSQPAGSHW